jgi:hypothetical protein
VCSAPTAIPCQILQFEDDETSRFRQDYSNITSFMLYYGYLRAIVRGYLKAGWRSTIKYDKV